jgi:hypothetical protein
VVVAVAVVRVVQVTGDQVVGVITVRDRLVPTAGAVLVAAVMSSAVVLRRAPIGIAL